MFCKYKSTKLETTYRPSLRGRGAPDLEYAPCETQLTTGAVEEGVAVPPTAGDRPWVWWHDEWGRWVLRPCGVLKVVFVVFVIRAQPERGEELGQSCAEAPEVDREGVVGAGAEEKLRSAVGTAKTKVRLSSGGSEWVVRTR